MFDEDHCTADKLTGMFDQQRTFMKLLQEKRGLADFPVDITSKNGQRKCKEVVYEIMGELFESIQELKHSKSHRNTDLSHDFNRDKLIEELVDAQHFFIELCLFIGVTPDELYDAYIRKGDKNVVRINSGY
jgi:hypothetical protein